MSTNYFDQPSHLPSLTTPTYVVGIGGPANVIDGYERLFLELPAGTDLAYIVVSPSNAEQDLMPSTLARCTHIPVLQIEQGMPLIANRVYIAPPGYSLSLVNSKFCLEDLSLAADTLIDDFFETLAQDQQKRVIAIMLSGIGQVGTRGIQAIKKYGGLVLIEKPQNDTANSAVLLADEVLTAEQLAIRVMDFAGMPRKLNRNVPVIDSDTTLRKILRLIRSHIGHDFTHYKRNTLVRRIDRRLKGHRLRDINQYIQLLEDSPAEIRALFQDLTINVTSFFRDSEALECLKDHLRSYI